MPHLINGCPGESIAITDGGFQYGHGVFETHAVQDGQPLLWSAHMQRLAKGCTQLGLAIPDNDLLWQEAQQLCQHLHKAVLKIIITRGSGGRGYRCPKNPIIQRILSVYPWPENIESARLQGVQVRICDTIWSEQPALAGLKHLNRLEQVLAQSEWEEPVTQEGLMLTADQSVISGTMSNLFIVKDQQLLTPALNRCGIAGIMRAALLDSCSHLKIPYTIRALQLEDILAADEAFLTNSLIGIWPIRQLKDSLFTLGSLSQQLLNHLIQKVWIVS